MATNVNDDWTRNLDRNLYMYINVDGSIHPDHLRDQSHSPFYIHKLRDRWSPINDRPCKHDSCSQCGGTGQKKNGMGTCIHMISCPCPRCSPGRC